ncbi:MAG: glycosyltransferase family 39 protein [Microcoleaceae cyanobacterium]
MNLTENPQPISKLSRQDSTWLNLKLLTWLIVGIGVFLRTVQYLLNRSLWIDEAFLALNITNRSFTELLEPLDYNQGAPVGFLWIEKVIINLFGDSEYALRLFPFLCGIGSVFLFFRLARQYIKLPTLYIALGLFALCDRLIYYSAEVKQYSSDVAIALLLYLTVPRLGSDQRSGFDLLICAVLGAVAIWISHPSVFILAGVGLTLLLNSGLKREWKAIPGYFLVFFTWLASFAAFYLISIQKLINNEDLQSSWDSGHNSFAPLIPTSLTHVRWFIDKFFEIFDYPVGIHLAGIAALAFIIGAIFLWRQERQTLFLLLSPILITLFVSGLHKYPFKGQLLLFLVPAIILMVATGTQQIIHQTWNNARLIGVIFTLLLLFYPVYYAAGNLKNPESPPKGRLEYQRIREEIKPVLSYVEQNWQMGDILYLYYAAQYAFKYYADRGDFKVQGLIDQTTPGVWPPPPEDWFAPALPSYPPQLIVGQYSREDWRIFQQEVDNLAGDSRVWVIFAHAPDRRSDLDEEDMFIYLLDQAGNQLDAFQEKEASVYLYDFSQSEKTSQNNNLP